MIDPRKGNLKNADKEARHPLTVEMGVPLRLNKKVKNSANSETESGDDRRSISAYHIP